MGGNAMAQKKLWSQLADSTKKRYKRAGVTAAMYNSPKKRKENVDLFRTAMGHAPMSYTAQRAKQLGIDEVIPKFYSLPRKQQDYLADTWSGELRDRPERIKRARNYGIDGVIPFDSLSKADQQISADLWLNVMHTKDAQTGHLSSRDDYERARLQFLGWLDSIGLEDDIENWKMFKELYKSSF
jgi:hypothetical protein